MDPALSEAVSEAFVRLHDKGLVYRGEYMVNWAPLLQTAVSDLEVEYSEEEGKAVLLQVHGGRQRKRWYVDFVLLCCVAMFLCIASLLASSRSDLNNLFCC